MKKCNSCRHFQNGLCFSSEVWQRTDEFKEQSIEKPPTTLFKAQALDVARDICDREGDGIFVFFESITSQPAVVGYRIFTAVTPRNEILGSVER